jgi:hypothetical protein
MHPFRSKAAQVDGVGHLEVVVFADSYLPFYIRSLPTYLLRINGPYLNVTYFKDMSLIFPTSA